MKEIHTSIHIPAPAMQVWASLVDFPTHKTWNPLFASIQGHARAGEVLRVAARKDDGREGMIFRPKVLEAIPGQCLRWRGSLLVRGLFDGEHHFELHEQADQSTQLIHKERFSGLLVPLMGSLLAKTKQGFEQFNQALSQQVLARVN